MRRTLRGSVTTVLVGLVLLGVFATGGTVLSDRAADFELHGARTHGVVVAVDPSGSRRSGSMEVRYAVDGVERVRSLSLDDASREFFAGEPIAAPGMPNDPGWAVTGLAILLIGGFATTVVGVIDVSRHLGARYRRPRRRGRPVPREPRR